MSKGFNDLPPEIKLDIVSWARQLDVQAKATSSTSEQQGWYGQSWTAEDMSAGRFNPLLRVDRELSEMTAAHVFKVSTARY
jgi:hypothetical protein